MVPIMTGYANMTQHVAVGTSSAAVAGTGVAAAASFGSGGALDFAAAAALASTAMLTARAGARYTKAFSPVALARAFACFQCFVAPMVPLKAHIVRSSKVAAKEKADDKSGATATGDTSRLSELLQLAAVGSVGGFAAGMFGIGGGVVLTPALCLLTDMPHACVLGTTLASMVPPSLVSASTHAQMGNVAGSVVGPLVIGSAIGAFCGGQLVLQLPEEPLQWAFAIFCFVSGSSKLMSLRGKV